MNFPVMINLTLALVVCVLLYRLQANHVSFTKRVFTGLGLGVQTGQTHLAQGAALRDLGQPLLQGLHLVVGDADQRMGPGCHAVTLSGEG